MVAEDLEKDEISRKKRERQERKIAKKNGVPIPQSDDWERKKQRLPQDNGEAMATSASCFKGSFLMRSKSIF